MFCWKLKSLCFPIRFEARAAKQMSNGGPTEWQGSRNEGFGCLVYLNTFHKGSFSGLCDFDICWSPLEHKRVQTNVMSDRTIYNLVLWSLWMRPRAFDFV